MYRNLETAIIVMTIWWLSFMGMPTTGVAQERVLNRLRIEVLEQKVAAGEQVDQALVVAVERLHQQLEIRSQEVDYLQRKLSRLNGELDSLLQVAPRAASPDPGLLRRVPQSTNASVTGWELGYFTPNGVDSVRISVAGDKLHFECAIPGDYRQFGGEFVRVGRTTNYRGVLSAEFKNQGGLRSDAAATIEFLSPDRICLTTTLPITSPILLTTPDGRRKISLVRL